MKSGNAKKSFIEIPKENWHKYKVVKRKQNKGKIVTNVFLNKNAIFVVTLSICELCGKEYKLYGRRYCEYFPEVYRGRGRFCSLDCANLARHNFWSGRKRNPAQFHRGRDHHFYGKDFKSMCKGVDWVNKKEEELTMEEAIKYHRVKKALLDGKTVLKVIKVSKGVGVMIKVITAGKCINCGKATASDGLQGGRVCSRQCAKEYRCKSHSSTLKRLYKEGTYSGTRGFPAWNKGMKIDKNKYPNWGLGEWLKLTDQERLKRINVFTHPRRKKVSVGGITYLFRSNFEIEVAKTLSSLKIQFEYEKAFIPLKGHKRYLPDFYLPEYGVYIEVKCLCRMVKCDKLSLNDIKHYIRKVSLAVKKETNCNLLFLWHERFYANPEGSILNILNKVGMNPQRPGIEDSITNNIPVGDVAYA